MDDKRLKTNEEDDFLDFSEIKEEINDGPTEEEFTQAINAMSETDRDIFEDTGIIHIDRDMPAETQAMHVIHLQKENAKRKNKIVKIILFFMCIGLVVACIGLFMKNDTQKTSSVVEETKTDEVEETEALLAVDEATFPDELFRSYILKSFDQNGDGSLSAEERNSVIAIIVPEDTALTSLKGIEYFPLLQSLTITNSGVTEIDLSSNKNLTYVDCGSSPIVNIILPENTFLNCQMNDSGTYTTCKINE